MKRGQSGLNLLLAVAKPVGMTSHDVVDKVRRGLGERRVGHAGTLDPAASGLLIVGVGQGTRLMGMLTLDRKSYEARITFGSETTTDDAEGGVVRTAGVPSQLADASYARSVLSGLIGTHEQVPPAYSAISINGRRAYALAREGKDVKLEARTIEIEEAQLLAVRDAGGSIEWDCAFTVSKGTYIRSIARDLGRQLGTAAHLSALCRTASGRITLAHAVALDKVAEAGPEHIAASALDPAWALGLPVRRLTEAELTQALQGKTLDARGLVTSGGDRVSLVRDGKVYGIWEMQRGRLRTVANFPAGIAGVHGE